MINSIKTRRCTLIFILVTVSILLVNICITSSNIFAINNKVYGANNIKNSNSDLKDNIITISFAGDVTLGGYDGQTGSGLFKDIYNSNDSKYFFENVRYIFAKDDITYVNLEGPLTDRGGVIDKEYVIRGSKEYAEILLAGEVEVVSLANNHSYDSGKEGLEDTKEALDSYGIYYSNAGEPMIFNAKGIKVALLSARGNYYSSDVINLIKSDIKKARDEKADIIIIMFHWGIEGENYSNDVQQSLAYECIDSGVDVVVGAHPHVMQGIEIYDGKPIVYSLGNYCFGANKNPYDKDTFVFQQSFVKNQITGEISIGSSKVIPCSISSVYNINDYRPTPLVEEGYDRVINRLRQYSSIYKDGYR